MKLKGKVALVTGGGRGIGRGIALALSTEGADVAIADIDYSNAQRVTEEVTKAGRNSIAVKVDVTNWAQVHAMIKRTIEELGRLDIMVNNAGVISVAPVELLDEDAWDHVMTVNAKGTFLCCKAVIPHMKSQGSGKIINLSSIAGKMGVPSIAHYVASKFAIVGFTNALAKELAKDNITVNAICPGFVDTYMWDILTDGMKLLGESREETFQRIVNLEVPQGRPQTSEDMGMLAVFFATNDNVTGQAWNVSGGAVLY